jgi:hypothetical protein
MRAKHGGVKPKPLQAVKTDKLPSMEPNRNESKIKAKVAEDLSNKGNGAEAKAPTYGEMLEKFNQVASKKEKEEINNGKNPKKNQLIAFFSKSK